MARHAAEHRRTRIGLGARGARQHPGAHVRADVRGGDPSLHRNAPTCPNRLARRPPRSCRRTGAGDASRRRGHRVDGRVAGARRGRLTLGARRPLYRDGRPPADAIPRAVADAAGVAAAARGRSGGRSRRRRGLRRRKRRSVERSRSWWAMRRGPGAARTRPSSGFSHSSCGAASPTTPNGRRSAATRPSFPVTRFLFAGRDSGRGSGSSRPSHHLELRGPGGGQAVTYPIQVRCRDVDAQQYGAMCDLPLQSFGRFLW